MLEAVIFDMDGVIVDTEPVYFRAINGFLNQFGYHMDKKYNEKFFGFSSYDAWSTIKKDFALENVSVAECVQGMMQIRNQIIKEEGYAPIKGTVSLIKELHEAGIPMAVASSSALKDIEEITKYFGIRDCFKDIVSGIDECENAKPFPDVFLKAADKLGIRPDRCLVIEDSDNGALAAKRAEMKVIGYRNPDFGNQALENADYIVETMEDVNLKLCQKVGE